MPQRILIVDDSGTARMLIKRCIEIAGYADADFVESKHGEEALVQLEAEKPDLVVTDLNMPVMDGMELLRRIRSREELADVPVIVVTSTGNEAREDELLREGATAILPKPVSPAVVADTMDKLFGE